MVPLTICAPDCCSWALQVLFGGVIASTLDTALLQTAIVSPVTITLTSVTLQLSF